MNTTSHKAFAFLVNSITNPPLLAKQEAIKDMNSAATKGQVN